MFKFFKFGYVFKIRHQSKSVYIQNIQKKWTVIFPGLTHDSYSFINAAIISVLASAAASSFG